MKIKIEAEVDDSFEKGECFLCPFSFSNDGETYDCILPSDECPAEREKQDD